jgi:Flp pilus assembly pilin Flp
MLRAIKDFMADSSGSAALEYCLVASAFAFAFVAGFSAMGVALGRFADYILSGLAIINAMLG